MDGWRFLFGFKLAGITFRFPFYLISPDNSVTSEQSASQGHDIMSALLVYGLLQVGTLGLRYLHLKKEAIEVRAWELNNLTVYIQG